jgi:UDPglucose--hexose-1-phosphate uridylyltransferase
MSEWRADPVTGQWTLVADELPLARRDYVLEGGSHPLDTPCPLCEGREATAGREILAVRNGSPADGPGWQLRVVPNQVPALRVEAGTVGAEDGLLRHRPGLGAHEVVVESPHHDRSWFTMSADELGLVFRAWRSRMADLRHDARLRAAMAFKNHGAEAGVRLVHPHSQVMAMPLVPPHLAQEVDAARRHHVATGRCLMCDLVAQERASGLRVVADRGTEVLLAPYASRVPFETWIVPTGHGGRFDEAPDDVVDALAAAVRHLLDRMAAELEAPAFNAVLHSAPFDEPGGGVFHWHLEVLPRVLRAGGFDLGSGVPVNPVAPEKAARVLRAGG